MMKKLITIVILLMTFSVTHAQKKANIKQAVETLSQNEPDKLPFYRLKTEWYRYAEKGRKWVGEPIADKTVKVAALFPSDNYSGINYSGNVDFHNSEKMRNANGVLFFPTLFKSSKIFQSSVNRYLLIPFLISSADGYYDDLLVSCDRNNGDVLDTLLVFQSGYDMRVNDERAYIVIRQWSLNEKKEVIVYELKLLTNEKTYFENAPVILRMQRIDTTYQIDENGKFYVLSKKEYQPKDYRKEELYRDKKQIWEGDEIPIK